MFILLAKSASKVHLTIIILERKKGFLDSKIRKLKSPRIRIFPKELVNGFRQKFEIFPCFNFWQSQSAKCV